MNRIQLQRRRLTATLASIAAVASSLSPIAARAEDDTEKLAILGGLGLTAATGKATLGTDAGSLEAMLLMAALLEEYGTSVRKKALGAVKSSADRVIVVSETEKLDLRAKLIFDTRLKLITEQLDAIPVSQCKTTANTTLKSSGGGNKAALDASPIGIANALLGALRTDTTVTGIKADVSDYLLISAVLSAAPGTGRWFLPAERQFGDRADADTLQKQTERANGLLLKCKGKPDIVKSLNEALAIANGLSAPGKDGAASILEQAVFLSGIDPLHTYILRIGGTKSGGSLVNQSNIWTTLGADGVSIRGGLVSSWRLISASTGLIESSGTIHCATPAFRFTSVHKAILDPVKHKLAANCVSKL